MDLENSKNYGHLLQEGGDNSSRRSSMSSTTATINKNKRDKENAGNQALPTREALIRLHDDIKQEIILMKNEYAKRRLISWLQESISFKSELSKMRWPSVLFMTAQAIAHFIVAFILNVENLATNWVGFQGFVLTGLLVFNLTVNLWDTKLRFKELLMKAEQIRDLIWRCSQDKHLLKKWKEYSWNSADAKRLFIPKSPCVHQTLAYRDESCLNLPDFLLVRGDIIHLFPGERAPGDCISLRTNNGQLQRESDREEFENISLRDGEIFHSPEMFKRDSRKSDGPSGHKFKFESDDVIAHARLKKANKGTDFLMLTTPYIKSLRISLQRSHKRPVNSIEKECFIVSRKYFETYVIPSVFCLSTVVTAIHYGYLDLTDSDQQIKTISIAYLLLRPSLTIMPFLPWMFPCFWMAVNAYGSARLLCCAESQRNKTPSTNGNSSNDNSPSWNHRTPGPDKITESSKFENLLATPTAAGSSDQNKHDEDDLHDLRSNIKFSSIFKVFIDLIKGKGGHVWRSSSLLQVLGCLTSLCCIDKVGILSWANPSPEKVFVLTRANNEESRRSALAPPSHSDENQTASEENQQTLTSINGVTLNNQLKSMMDSSDQDDQVSNHNNQAHSKHLYTSQSKHEVLDVSQTFNAYRGVNETMLFQQASRLQFDDLNWRRYIDNLKPLGLAILMNNCCEKSFGDYFRFYKHISYESILRCNLTPVVKRRCICAISELIGFSRGAVKNYEYINHIGAYKLIDPSTIKKGKLVSSLENTTRLKLPFPNMICNIHRDSSSGSYQVFSQGTADVILDACVEFWDGKQLVPLDESARKKVKDFYHRTSLTSYCSAFSYTPLLKGYNLGDHYIELPSENSKLSLQMRKLANERHEEFLQKQIINVPSPLADETVTRHIYESNLSSQDNMQLNSLSITPIPALKHFSGQTYQSPKTPMLRRHLSVENIHSYDYKSKDSMHYPLSEGRKPKRARKLDEVLEEITDQVFIGMVAMQYQACPDFVGLVEQLEHACIRFVHFSKENELRSRVFSEKMGLESGWNCHISLQSDQDLDKANKSGANFSKILNQGHADDSGIFTPSTRASNILIGVPASAKSDHKTAASVNSNDTSSRKYSMSSDERTLYSWQSLPSLVMQVINKVSSTTTKHHHHPSSDQTPGVKAGFVEQANSSCDDMFQSTEYDDTQGTESSTKDESFESLAFDMSNRAKLPKGVENIRPHLETVDNIPLQVSLFTDCTPGLTKEMIEIMQDYGEIVCVIGSASSKLNTPIFLQANASIAIEPLMPQSCTRSSVKKRDSPKRRRDLHSRPVKKRHSSEYQQSGMARGQYDDDNIEFTAVQIVPRPNNPRDRLGIGPVPEPNGQLRGKRRRRVSTSSESSRSEAATASSSSSRSSSSSKTSCSSSSIDFDYKFKSENFIDEGTLSVSDEDISDLSGSLVNELPEPSSLASKLASLPCSYSYNRKEQVNLYSLIMEARHFTFKMKNTFVCMICFALSISSAQFLASILFLPPMLSSGLTIWLTVVVVPLMSFSLMSTTMDSQVMKIAVGKNLQLKPENITFFVICYLIKFIPSIIVVVLNFGLIIAHSCKLTGFGSSSLGPCWMFTYVQHGNATSSDDADEDLLWSTHLLTAQISAAFLIVLYFGKRSPVVVLLLTF